jgi:hypothetical protein
MKKKILLGITAAVLAMLFITGILAVELRASKCIPVDGSGVCVGECCMTYLTGGCVAGPCDKIFK